MPIEEIVGSSVVGPSGNHECWSFLAVNFRLPSLDSYPGVLKILLQRCYYCSSCGQFFYVVGFQLLDYILVEDAM